MTPPGDFPLRIMYLSAATARGGETAACADLATTRRPDRMRAHWNYLLCLALLSGSIQVARASAPAPLVLHDGWALQSSCAVQASGAQLSTPAYRPQGWRTVAVPSTVLAAQVATGQFKDPFFGANLRAIPGTSYPVGANFSNLPMQANSPYACGWWYRRQFPLPASARGRQVWLHLGGINYRGSLWLNGRQVAGQRDIAGAYRVYDINVTAAAAPGRNNTLAIEVFAPTEKDLGINWVDWSPAPPDKDMGINGPVSIRLSGPVSVRSPLVTTHFADASLATADIAVSAEVANVSAVPEVTTLHAILLGRARAQRITLAPGERRSVLFPPLHIAHPRPWWPYQMGTPHLETLHITAAVSGALSDEVTTRFGIREVTSEVTEKGFRLFHVNGKPVFIRGGGWSQDMMLREDPARLAQQFALIRDLHLNTIRLEGKLETDDFFRLADEQGILVMAGWCCCDQWEKWAQWTPENYSVAAASLRSQMLRLRSHPSLLAWLNGSDNPPPANVESAYLAIEKEARWPNPVLSSASARATSVSGASGVKMTGPYDYVAPSYWLADTGRHGGAWGFNTETSPGPAIPNTSSLRQFLPEDQLWPRGDQWNYHNGSQHFARLTVFDTAMQHTYGDPQSLAQYEKYAQTTAYDSERAMFEAYSRQRYRTTGGIVQWMLNNAWPSMIWHLYDYYLDAGGGYYGARKANEPLHVQYSYDDHSIVLINNTSAATSPVLVRATVLDANLRQLYTHEEKLAGPADSSSKAFTLPASLFGGAGLRFVVLALLDAQGRPVSDNFYWIPEKLTTFDWANTDFTHTPAATFEDLHALSALPPSHLTATLRSAGPGTILTLHNDSQALAFQVTARALASDGKAIDPAFWSDNYIELLPGESRTLTVHTPSAIASVSVSGWNTGTQQLHAVAAKRNFAPAHAPE